MIFHTILDIAVVVNLQQDLGKTTIDPDIFCGCKIRRIHRFCAPETNQNMPVSDQ